LACRHSARSARPESYPTPYASGIERVGTDFSNYVAFWKEVQVTTAVAA